MPAGEPDRWSSLWLWSAPHSGHCDLSLARLNHQRILTGIYYTVYSTEATFLCMSERNLTGF